MAGLKKMKNQVDLSPMKQDALYAYLEYCKSVQVVPNKEVYETIVKFYDSSKIDSLISFIEIEHGNFERGKNNPSDVESFVQRFLQQFELKPFELSQMVKLDNDSEKEIEQSVNYDPSEHWMCITHDTSSITLRVENWYKLEELVTKTLSKL